MRTQSPPTARPRRLPSTRRGSFVPLPRRQDGRFLVHREMAVWWIPRPPFILMTSVDQCSRSEPVSVPIDTGGWGGGNAPPPLPRGVGDRCGGPGRRHSCTQSSKGQAVMKRSQCPRITPKKGRQNHQKSSSCKSFGHAGSSRRLVDAGTSPRALAVRNPRPPPHRAPGGVPAGPLPPLDQHPWATAGAGAAAGGAPRPRPRPHRPRHRLKATGARFRRQ